MHDTIGYVIAQYIGAIIASGVLCLLASGGTGFTMPEWRLGGNGWGDGYLGGYSMTSTLVAEFVFTFLFLLVIFGARAKNASPARTGLAIGISLALMHMVAIPITGTSVNPARSLGPALFVDCAAISQIWLFIDVPSGVDFVQL